MRGSPLRHRPDRRRPERLRGACAACPTSRPRDLRDSLATQSSTLRCPNRWRSELATGKWDAAQINRCDATSIERHDHSHLLRFRVCLNRNDSEHPIDAFALADLSINPPPLMISDGRTKRFAEQSSDVDGRHTFRHAARMLGWKLSAVDRDGSTIFIRAARQTNCHERNHDEVMGTLCSLFRFHTRSGECRCSRSPSSLPNVRFREASCLQGSHSPDRMR